MKTVIILGDGMSDHPVKALDVTSPTARGEVVHDDRHVLAVGEPADGAAQGEAVELDGHVGVPPAGCLTTVTGIGAVWITRSARLPTRVAMTGICSWNISESV